MTLQAGTLPHLRLYNVGSSTFFMCNIVVINRGEKEIETPRQFLEHFGFEAPKEEHYRTVDMDCCLCQVDIEKALTEHNIPFKTDCGDFYVGQLDEVVGDAE